MSEGLKKALGKDIQAIKRWLNFNNLILVLSLLGLMSFLLMIILFSWSNLKLTLLEMGAFYINVTQISIISLLSFACLIYIIYYWFFAKNTNKKRLFKLIMFIIIAIAAFAFLISLTLPFVENIYPGLREAGKTYPPQFWEENNFSASFKGFIGGLYVYNAHNPKEIYFTEGDEIFGQVRLSNPDYIYTIFLTKDGEEEIMLGSYKNETAIINFNITKNRQYHFEIGAANSSLSSSLNEKRVAMFDIYPNVMTSEKTNERKRDLVVIMGSLLAAITMISVSIAKRIIEVIEK
ncbi:hypothetical protein HYT26_00020 [Candidatus Pacearchaeota archaeon]|nr:hypothetical protein [Candidatus Pacearchaeota archaeon]